MGIPWFHRLLVCPVCQFISAAGEWIHSGGGSWICPMCGVSSDEDLIIEHKDDE